MRMDWPVLLHQLQPARFGLQLQAPEELLAVRAHQDYGLVLRALFDPPEQSGMLRCCRQRRQGVGGEDAGLALLECRRKCCCFEALAHG